MIRLYQPSKTVGLLLGAAAIALVSWTAFQYIGGQLAGDNTVQDNVPNGKALILRQYDRNAGYSGTMCEFVDGQTVCECGEENTDVALLYPNGARFNVTLYSYDRCLGGPDNATNQKYKAGTWVKVEDDNITGVIKHPPSTSGSFEWEKSMSWL